VAHFNARGVEKGAELVRLYRDPTNGGAKVDMAKAWWKVDDGE
jgi:hypothetical protein